MSRHANNLSRTTCSGSPVGTAHALHVPESAPGHFVLVLSSKLDALRRCKTNQSCPPRRSGTHPLETTLFKFRSGNAYGPILLFNAPKPSYAITHVWRLDNTRSVEADYETTLAQRQCTRDAFTGPVNCPEATSAFRRRASK